MLSKVDIARGATNGIARKAGYTLPLKPTMIMTESPLSLSDSKVRRLTNNLRKSMKDARPEASVSKAEVVNAKNVRGVVQLLIRKILDDTIDNDEADRLIDEAQQQEDA
jgi:hypothetical protein